MTMTSDFRSEVEIWPFRTCTMKTMQYNPYLWPKFSCLKGNWGRGTRWWCHDIL